jgi:hypothetical protein
MKIVNNGSFASVRMLFFVLIALAVFSMISCNDDTESDSDEVAESALLLQQSQDSQFADCEKVLDDFGDADIQCGTMCAAACSYAVNNNQSALASQCASFNDYCTGTSCSYCQ